MPLTTTQRRLIGRMGGQLSQVTNDPKATMKRARAARWQQFLDRVDPERLLPEEERNRRATHLQNAHMTRIAYERSRSATARQQRRANLDG